MKRHLFPYLGYGKANEEKAIKAFENAIAEGVERGETLDQMAERISEDETPKFYGAQFRAAYNEGFEQGSAYGYEQPLDHYEAMRQEAFNTFTWFDQASTYSMDFNRPPVKTVEAEFEVIKTTLK